MKRKDFLFEELSKEEKSYLKILIINTKKKYIRENYNYVNYKHIEFKDCIDLESDSIIDIVIRKCEEEIKTAIQFEKIIYDDKLRSVIKTLTLEEKIVLFSLYKIENTINEIATEMKKDRTTIWRLKNKALDKIMKKLLGGN